VWVGFDHPQTITTKGYGAALALPIWAHVMEKASAKRYPATAFAPPEQLVHVQVCSYSNLLANAGCEAAGNAYFIDLPASRVPTAICTAHAGSQLGEATQAPGAPGSPTPAAGDQEDAFPKRLMRSLGHLFGR
jgi:membrane carboxypeptidase/penicillin-binding protein